MKPLRTLLLSAWLLVLGTAVHGQVTITEFLASNSHGLTDIDGDHSDWIELFNGGPTVVNLKGWSLTDNVDQPRKWVFPAVPLNPGAYLVVFASGKDRTNAATQLHTSFSLSAAGEYLALFPPESDAPTTEFAPAYPSQRTDISYGVRAGQRYYFNPPSPGAANTGGVGDFVADTKFNRDRGLYDTPFDLVISCDTVGATIRYTTNGAPPTLAFGLTYVAPINIARSVVVRAAAFKDGLQPSDVDTQTYLFLADVIRQQPTGTAPWPEWPAPGSQSQTFNYGMDKRIVDGAAYKDQIVPALRALPTFSVVTTLSNLFDRATGIFSNAGQDGRGWERPCSLELIFPDGRKGFQIDCGIRIRGGYSRSTGNPKHAFRFFFREEYGVAKLKFPLHEGGTDEFDALDLRTFQNYSWSFEGDTRGVFIRDVFSRDSQLAMGQQGERGNYYHLYIDGIYWGIYNSAERPEASFGATYFGGVKEDYDVVKVEAGPYALNATDGTMDAWTRLYNQVKAITPATADAVYRKVQGLNPDGTPNPAYENLVEIDNLIDYMLVIVYGGNLDAPISNFLGNTRPNNWYGLRNRTGVAGGFRFMAHDSEHTLLDVNQNRLGPFSAGSDSVVYSSPQYVWQQLWQSPEFRVRIADRTQRHFFNGGVFTTASAQARFGLRTNQLYLPVVAESARWGDSKVATPLTRDGNWLPTANQIERTYMVQRSAIVLNQLRAKNLFPKIGAPVPNPFGGVVAAGTPVTLTGPDGAAVLYSLNGADPRLPGGAENPGARLYTAPIVINGPVTLRTRTHATATTNEWSGMVEVDFYIAQDFTRLQLTELMYHPAPDPASGFSRDDFEFIELKNAGAVPLDLSGVRFSNGLDYAFPRGTVLAPGQHLVLASNRAAFTYRYPGRALLDTYAGLLDNNGEHLTLAGPDGAAILDLTYNNKAPWPEAADGLGFSLVPRDPDHNPDPADPANWRASSIALGSPGNDDVAAGIPVVQVNEILSHTDLPELDAVELFNPGSEAADISGWYLTDDRGKPRKYRFPAGTSIAPGGYLTVDESGFNASALGTNAFQLSSHGDAVFIYSANAAGDLTGFSDGTGFDAAANGESFGRHTNSVGLVEFVPQIALTLGAVNAGPRIGPVVLNEIYYSPPVGELAFVEIRNISALDQPLYDVAHATNTWRIGGLGFAFPEGVTLPPGGLAVVTEAAADRFRQQYGVPASVPVFGPSTGQFQRNGERLELLRPDAPDTVTNADHSISVIVPYVLVDAVRYNDRAPWPLEAAGGGSSLERRVPVAYGNDPASWRAAPGGPSPGLGSAANRSPRVNAGPDRELSAASFPLSVDLAGFASDDGLPDPPGILTLHWSQVDGPAGVVFNAGSSSNGTVQVPGQGVYTLRLTASDGEHESSDDVQLTVTRPGVSGTIVPFGSVWRYSDLRQDLGTAWRQPGFDDSAWKSGPARMGFGGDGEVTVIDGGPDGDRIPTVYFRLKFNVAGAKAVSDLNLQVIRDDGIILYINGTEVYRSNMPDGDAVFSTWASSAIGGADETTPLSAVVSPAVLVDGVNVMEVELHQANPTSSDLGLDVSLTGTVSAVNVAPTADAGPDLTVTLPDVAKLSATFTDDGLPQPPGVPTFLWSKVSGPGSVGFISPGSLATTAVIGAAGDYVLQFQVNDGQLSASDTVAVRVLPAVVPPLVLTALRGNPVTLQFRAEAGQAYQVRFRTDLVSGDWLKLTDVPAARERTVELPDAAADAQRFYQVVGVLP